MSQLALAFTLLVPCARQDDPPPATTSVTGRVLDESGAPVAGAEVCLWRHTPEFLRPSKANEEGRFALAVSGSGEHELRAWASDRGCASATVKLDPEAGTREVDLVLHGPGELSGVLLDSAGEPLANALLWAITDRVLEPAASPLDIAPLSLGRGLQSLGNRGLAHELDDERGLAWDETRTGADGSFFFRGLAPGRYFLQVRGLRGAVDQVAYETGTQGIKHRIEEHVIALRPVNQAGEPLPADRVVLLPLPDRPMLPQVPWYQQQLNFDPRKGGRIGADGYARFAVEPGRRYRLVYFSPEHAYSNLVIAPDDWRSVRSTFLIPDYGAPGTLELHFETEDGRPFRDFCSCLIHSQEVSAIVKVLWVVQLTESPVVESLPTGAYALVVSRAAPLNCTPESRDDLGLDDLIVPFWIEPGERTVLRISTFDRGYVRLQLAWPAGERYEKLAGLLELDRRLGTGRAAEIAWGGELLAVRDFFYAASGSPLVGFVGDDGEPMLPVPGRWTLSRPLSPGTHELVFSLPGFQPVERRIEIHSGEVTELEVQLEQRPTHVSQAR